MKKKNENKWQSVQPTVGYAFVIDAEISNLFDPTWTWTANGKTLGILDSVIWYECLGKLERGISNASYTTFKARMPEIGEDRE